MKKTTYCPADGRIGVSVRNGQEPAAVSGGTLTLYETKRDFRNYRITRDGAAQVVLTLRGHQA